MADGAQDDDLGPSKNEYRSFFVLTEENSFRKACKQISESKAFEYLILLAIIFSCVLMAINGQLPNSDMSNMNKLVEQIDSYMLVLFGLEMLLNMVTMGLLLHSGAYLRNPWNILDFVVVITGILGLPQLAILKGGGVKALKAMRVLRPLKLVSGVPSLQIVMTSIAKSMVPLANVCMLVAFFVVIYAVVGQQLLQGLFHFTCYDNSSSKVIEAGRLCESKAGRPCPTGTQCKRYWSGPNDGITSFDNIFLSMLTIFTCITCEGWTNTMYWTFDVADKRGVGFWLFYYSLFVVGAQFMLNLVLGVLSGEFGKEGERLKTKAEFYAQVDQEAARGSTDQSADKGIDVLAIQDTNNAGGETEQVEGQTPQLPQPAASRAKLIVKKIIHHNAFVLFMMACVFLNTATIATQYHGQGEMLALVQDICSIVFMTVFLMEMCLKFFALGLRGYFKSSFNAFDAVVVVCGIVEMVLYYTLGITLGVSVLRALKLLKLFKFTRHWKSLKNLIGALVGSIQQILSLMLLLVIFLMIFALLGMTLFGGKFSYKEEPSRTNFDDFWSAFLACFQILTGEDWNFVMYEGVLANGGPKDATGLLMSLYFVGLVVIGNYVLLNVFLAIAVDNLTQADLVGGDEGGGEIAAVVEASETSSSSGTMLSEEEKMKAIASGVIDEFQTDSIPRQGGKAKPGQNLLENLKNPGRMTGNIPGGPGSEMLQVRTLFSLMPDSRIRKYAHMIVTSAAFDPFILGCILFSSALLALENVVDESAPVNKILLWFDFFFTPLFFIEVLLKVIHYGLIMHNGAYLRDGWNIMDTLVVAAAIASLILSNDPRASPQSQKVVKILKLLRVLRPLKSVNKSKNLKAVFQCMIYSVKNVINIFIITMMFLFVFAAMAVQLFAGKFFYCTDPSKTTEATCQGKFITFTEWNYYKPYEAQRQWLRYKWNFDNLINALGALFTASTGEGWPDLMYHAIDATDIEQGPLMNNQPRMALFFIFFVIVLSFFLLNIFVALIILTFQEEQSKGEKGMELDRNTRRCLEFAMRARPIQIFVPEDPKSIHYKVYTIIGTNAFDTFIMSLIIGNTILLMIGFNDQPEAYGFWLDRLNEWFNYLFTMELVLKLLAFSFDYFKDGWNVFDFVIVLGSWGDFIISRTMKKDQLPVDPSMLRLFRAARLVKLLNRNKNLKVLLFTFIQSFKALPYVGALIFLLFYVYSILGMHLFSHISLDQQEDPWAQINRDNNFRHFFAAFQVLFRSMTGENWPNIMMACSAPAECDPNTNPKHHNETCGSDVAWPYFISFIFNCSFLLLNLFVAVIMDNFAFLCQDASILGPHHLDDFIQAWSEYDPRGRGYIRHYELCQLLRELNPPLGLGAKCPKLAIYRKLIRMNMLMREDGTVNFNATLYQLCRTSSLQVCMENNNLRKNDAAQRRLLKRLWPNITQFTMNAVLPKKKGEVAKRTCGQLYTAKMVYEKFKYTKKKAANAGKNALHVLLKGRKKSLAGRARGLMPKAIQNPLADMKSADPETDADTNEANKTRPLRQKATFAIPNEVAQAYDNAGATTQKDEDWC